MLRSIVRYARIAWPSFARTTTHDDGAFRRWAAPWMVTYVALLFAIAIVGNIGAFVVSRAAHVPEQFDLTPLVVATIALCLAVIAGLSSRLARRHIEVFGGGAILVGMAIGAHYAAPLPHDPFFWPGMLAIFAFCAFLLPLWRRVAWTLAAASIHNGVWLASSDAWPTTSRLIAGLNVYASGALLAIALGHLLYVVARQLFADRVALREKTRALERYGADLSSEVQARTEELAVLARRVERVHEDERRRLAHELHDELGQSLTALRLELAAIDAGAMSVDARDGLDARLDELLESVHWTVSSLRPRPLEDHGLREGARWLIDRFAARWPVRPELRMELSAEPPPQVALTLFRVLQEALTNVAKHAEAGTVAISLRHDDGALLLEVSDDGAGFDADRVTAGHGLLGMKERALAVGGRLTLTSGTDGTRVALRVPTLAVAP